MFSTLGRSDVILSCEVRHEGSHPLVVEARKSRGGNLFILLVSFHTGTRHVCRLKPDHACALAQLLAEAQGSIPERGSASGVVSRPSNEAPPLSLRERLIDRMVRAAYAFYPDILFRKDRLVGGRLWGGLRFLVQVDKAYDEAVSVVLRIDQGELFFPTIRLPPEALPELIGYLTEAQSALKEMNAPKQPTAPSPASPSPPAGAG